MTRQISVNE